MPYTEKLFIQIIFDTILLYNSDELLHIKTSKINFKNIINQSIV